MKEERVHLCPMCQIVEMKFKERVASKSFRRLRRFSCPICEFEEMYISGGPDDAATRTKSLELDREKLYTGVITKNTLGGRMSRKLEED